MANFRRWQHVWANIWFQKLTIIPILGIKFPDFCSLHDFYLHVWENFALAHTYVDLMQNLLSDRLWSPLL